ncbi:BamA/TamA family outer membrane protein [Sphingobacterium paludis]|uniref:Surface antigen-like protein n=1 Tax=Sphingobacterium paludis TaxID=1476465 RepID=A0A4R7DAL9_9SPHI|nr:BamA/TamA family outer membrane protein [Sphingobacterium paludis]TDS17301.1 surface antigen-like protein [Sphingobacterium paludis]
MKKRNPFFFLFLYGILGLSTAKAQGFKNGWVGRYVNSIINDTTSAEKSTLTVYPTFASAPETGVELGASILKLFYAKGDTLNRLSEMQAFTFFTFKGQYGIVLDNAIYGDQDKWFFLGETKIQKFPLSYYGIGPNTAGDHPAVVDAFQVLFKQRVLRRIKKNLFVGPELDYQLLSGVNFEQPEEGSPYPIPVGGDGTQNLGFGLGLVYDNRHNVLNVREGLFAELAYLKTFSGFVSDYSFGTVNMEVRSFHKIAKNNVLAWQVKGQFLHGEVPFNQLTMLGGDRLMRGYYLGRYRDRNLIAVQAEYRMLPFGFSKRLGASVFASAGAVSPTLGGFQMRNVRVAGGVGLRYLLFPKKDIYIRFDVGFTREGANFYIFNGEAF